MSAPHAPQPNSELNIKNITVYGTVILLISVLAVALVIKLASSIAHSSNPQEDASAMARIAPVAKLEVAAVKVAGAPERTGEQLYTAACVACHGAQGAGNAQAFAFFQRCGFCDGALGFYNSGEHFSAWITVTRR